MARKITFFLALWLGIFGGAMAAFAEHECGDAIAAFDMLEEDWRESLLIILEPEAERQTQIWVNSQTGSWTILGVEGTTACILGSGDAHIWGTQWIDPRTLGDPT